MGNNKRVEWIDYAKGIGILLVVLGHINIPNLFKVWLYSFHMPLFFFLSGYLNKDTDISLKEYTKKKATSLLWPYAIISLLYLIERIPYLVLGKIQYNEILKQIIAAIYSAKIFEVNYVGAIWFLTALFSVEILYYIICKLRYNQLVLLTIGIMGMAYSNLINIRLPMGGDIAFTGIIFYALGKMFQKNVVAYTKWVKKKYAFIFLLINIITCMFNYIYLKDTFTNGRIDMLYLQYGNPILFYISSICGILFIIQVSKMYSYSIMGFLGKNSLILMAFHIYAIRYILLFTDIVGVDLSPARMINNVILILGTFVITSVGVLLINKYFNWIIKFPFKDTIDASCTNSLNPDKLN